MEINVNVDCGAEISDTDDIKSIENQEEPQIFDIPILEIKKTDILTDVNNHRSNNSIISCVGKLFLQLSRIIYEDYNQRLFNNRQSVDRKLRRIIEEKKQAQGIKDDRTIEQKY